MNFALLWPVGLWALAALVLPVLIHLTRQLQRTRTEFAALRWVSTTLRPRRRLRLRQWLLLLLRLLLLAVAVLLLAQPVLRQTQALPPWVVVAPDVAPGAVQALRARSTDAATWVWLADDFPALANPSATDLSKQHNGASLLRELDRQLPAGTPLTVLLPPRWAGMDGARLSLGREVNWQVLDADSATPQPTTAPQVKPASRSLPALVQVYSDAEGAAQQRVLRAVVAGWNALHSADQAAIQVVELTAVDAMPAPNAWVVWLAPGELPLSLLRWIESGGTAWVDPRGVLPQAADRWVLQRTPDGTAWVWSQRLGKGRMVQSARALELQAWPELVEPTAASRMLDWVYPEDVTAPVLADTRAVRPELDRAISADPPPRSWISPLALLLALLFLLERLCASWPRRSSL